MTPSLFAPPVLRGLTLLDRVVAAPLCRRRPRCRPARDASDRGRPRSPPWSRPSPRPPAAGGARGAKRSRSMPRTATCWRASRLPVAAGQRPDRRRGRLGRQPPPPAARDLRGGARGDPPGHAPRHPRQSRRLDRARHPAGRDERPRRQPGRSRLRRHCGLIGGRGAGDDPPRARPPAKFRLRDPARRGADHEGGGHDPPAPA